MSNPNPVWFLKPYKGPPLSARYSQNSLTPYSGSCTDPSARSAPPSLIAVTADSCTHTDRAPRLRSILSLPRPLHPAPGHPHPSAPQRSVPPCFSYIPLRLDWYPSPSCCTPLPDLPSHSMAPALCFSVSFTACGPAQASRTGSTRVASCRAVRRHPRSLTLLKPGAQHAPHLSAQVPQAWTCPFSTSLVSLKHVCNDRIFRRCSQVPQGSKEQSPYPGWVLNGGVYAATPHARDLQAQLPSNKNLLFRTKEPKGHAYHGRVIPERPLQSLDHRSRS